MPVKPPPSWVTQFKVIDRNLVIQFAHTRRVISSAVRGGGIGWAHAIVNHQVSESFHHLRENRTRRKKLEDPSRTLGKIAEKLGITGRCVGLMTLVDMRHLVLVREQAAGIWVEGFFTIGVTNAVRAGESASYVAAPGTINIILVTNVKLSMPALVGAVTVATESKTATLVDKGITSFSGSGLATGTGTDAIVIAIGEGPRLRYSGTHTKIGELIGKVVSKGMSQGLQKISRSRKMSKKSHLKGYPPKMENNGVSR